MSSRLAQAREGRPYVVVQVCLVEILAAADRFTCLCRGGEVNTRAGEAYGIGVVPALGDDGADEGRERVPRDTEPVGPRTPVAVIAGDGLADVENDGLNHLPEPRRRPGSVRSAAAFTGLTPLVARLASLAR
ncbi:hypothetical protein GCM10023080_091940 [Streptomyces pseudoechinosporeus]